MRGALLYEVLEVSPSARPAVIRAAYRCLAQEYHPDKKPGDTEAATRMSMINHAYSVLNDPVLRARYDAKLAASEDRRGRGPATKAAPASDGVKGNNTRPFAFRPL